MLRDNTDIVPPPVRGYRSATVKNEFPEFLNVMASVEKPLYRLEPSFSGVSRGLIRAVQRSILTCSDKSMIKLTE